MDRDAPTSELERRKQARLRVRGDLVISPQRYAGVHTYVIKDPVGLRYWHFPEKEYFLIRRLDGRTTLEEVQQQFEENYRPERMSLEDLEAFGQQLITSGLVLNDSPQLGQQFFDRRQKQRRGQLLRTLTNILYIRIPLVDPDRFLTGMLHYLRWMFTIWFLLASAAVLAAALLLVTIHFDEVRARLPDYQKLLSPRNLLTMWLVLGGVKVIHELGHGLSCKAFGGEVHDLGGLLLCFSPAMYCDVSDSWTLPSKWRRMIISGAGIYVELMLAALATFVWWNTTSSHFVNHFALSLMIVCSFSTLVVNANPLMRYDGYYLLADWLEIPNLSQRTNQYAQRLFQEYCLGIDQPEEAYLPPWRQAFFAAYAVASYVCRWTMTFGILWFVSQFLKPYKMETLGVLLAGAAGGLMLGRPLYQLAMNLHKRGGLPDMKLRRVATTCAVLGLFLSVFFLVPLPVAQVRQPGLVQVRSEAVTAIHVPAVIGMGRSSSVLERLHVQDGQHVVKGYVLAEFRNPELDLELEQVRTQYGLEEAKLRALQEMSNETKDETEQGRLRTEVAHVQGERDRLAERARIHESMRRQLILRAPRSGTVLSPPRIDDVGRQWDLERTEPFCNIGEPNRLRLLVPVSTADYKLLRDDYQEMRRRHRELTVDVRSAGSGLKRRRGQVAHLPHAEAQEVPWALTTESGGPVAARAAANHTFVPENQQYLIAIDLLDQDPSFYPGARAQVKIHCRRRTAAYWLWRTMGLTFDIGFLRG